MKRKILGNRDIRWQGEEASRLSYDMIFRDEERDRVEARDPDGKRGRKVHGSSSRGNGHVRPDEQGSGQERGPAEFGRCPDGSGRGDGQPERISEDDPERTPEMLELLEERDREWEEKLEKARKKAYKSGLEEGRKSGYEEAEAEVSRRSRKLEEGFGQAREEWKERCRLLDPGLLDLVFEITEMILGTPAENLRYRDHLEKEVADLLQRLDQAARPVLWISEDDLDWVKDLKETHARKISVGIRVSDSCRPGEYRLETDRETVIRDFCTILDDFKQSLSLPAWRDNDMDPAEISPYKD